MISEITRGWRSFERGHPRARQEMMIIEAYCSSFSIWSATLQPSGQLPE